MRKRNALLLVTLLLVAGYHAAVQATWSVIALERDSKFIVIASATCVPQQLLEKFPSTDLRDIQAIVVPGKGVAAAQAAVDRTRANQNLIFVELKKRTDPARILELLKADPAFEMRQFGIVDMQGRAMGSSGRRTCPFRWTGRAGCRGPRSTTPSRATSWRPRRSSPTRWRHSRRRRAS